MYMSCICSCACVRIHFIGLKYVVAAEWALKGCSAAVAAKQSHSSNGNK